MIPRWNEYTSFGGAGRDRPLSGVRVVGVFALQNGQRDPEAHTRSRVLLAPYLELAAERQRPLPHTREPHPGGLLGREPPAIVLDLHPGLVVHHPEGNRGAPGPGVAPDVGQRLLDDAHHLYTRPPRERGRELLLHDQL